MSKGILRRLAAIVAADVVEYSRLVREDEEATLRALRAHRQEFTDPLIAQFGGRIANTAGDSLLLEFPSAVEAVRCALAIQAGMAERNTGIDPERQITFRIGINVGDVVAEGDDLLGDGVNVAARLESLAEPGGIWLSRTARDQVRDQLDLDLEDLGEVEVKNIARPVRAFHVAMNDRAAALAATPADRPPKPKSYAHLYQAATGIVLAIVIIVGLVWWRPWAPDFEPLAPESMTLPLPDKPSIAVLAFENLSGDQAQEFFSDAVSESIITELSRFPELFVIARHSSFSYKGKPVKVNEISRELGVRYLVEGSVQRSVKRIRITVQLIDAISGTHIWAERYDRPLDEIFAIQDDITRTIVATVASKINLSERIQISQRQPTNLSAYEFWQLGQVAFHQWSREGNDEARQMYEKAIDADPEFARGYASLAWVYINGYRWGWTELKREDALKRARDLAHKAISFAPFDYSAHWTLANVHMQSGNQEQAIVEYQRAIELNPNAADVLVDGIEPLVYLGRAEEAVPQLKRAMRLNPFHPDWYWWSLGWAQYYSGAYEEALTSILQMNQMPNLARRTLAAVYVRLGRLDEAQAVIKTFLENSPDYTLEKWQQNIKGKFRNPADAEKMTEDLRKAGLPE